MTPDRIDAPVPSALRARLALALDVDDLVVATRTARQLRPWFGVAKVGLELFTAAGPDVVGLLADDGYEVFLDLKLHDIPTTVQRAASVAGSYGVRYLTLHAMGGSAMLGAGVDGLRTGALRAGLPPPLAVAITVLSSDADYPPHIVPRRVALARDAGCDGLVCPPVEVPAVRALAPDLCLVVPGTRPVGVEAHDQVGVTTPGEALAAGADLLVVGRAVTAAADPALAAAALVASLAGEG